MAKPSLDHLSLPNNQSRNSFESEMGTKTHLIPHPCQIISLPLRRIAYFTIPFHLLSLFQAIVELVEFGFIGVIHRGEEGQVGR